MNRCTYDAMVSLTSLCCMFVFDVCVCVCVLMCLILALDVHLIYHLCDAAHVICARVNSFC